MGPFHKQVFHNWATKHYTEVTSLLKERGIDLDHNRFSNFAEKFDSIEQDLKQAEGAVTIRDEGTNQIKDIKLVIQQLDTDLKDRLGNLGVIDDKYDVAISTACPALDNIVVDSIEVGQTCCVTFFLSNELPTMDMHPIQTPENVLLDGVVTLSGQIIDKPGTISGGGNWKKTVATLKCIRELNEEIRSLEPQFQEKKNELS
ncbi:7212_t:CDS:2 [Funneliformis caledonium]|uniref:7212_t:CDS:1 n=1 Tax=Funneliformis caledonium TaxID=1117310 RepID=A0A9N9BLJ5_9GLOM|nr:7212_t:CDS:2 [Funneliformis caledonium]